MTTYYLLTFALLLLASHTYAPPYYSPISLCNLFYLCSSLLQLLLFIPLPTIVYYHYYLPTFNPYLPVILTFYSPYIVPFVLFPSSLYYTFYMHTHTIIPSITLGFICLLPNIHDHLTLPPQLPTILQLPLLHTGSCCMPCLAFLVPDIVPILCAFCMIYAWFFILSLPFIFVSHIRLPCSSRHIYLCPHTVAYPTTPPSFHFLFFPLLPK